MTCGRARTRIAGLLALALAGCGGEVTPAAAPASASASSPAAAPPPAPTPAPDPPAPLRLTVRPLGSPARGASRLSRVVEGADRRLYMSWVEPGADGAHELRFAALRGDGWSDARTIATGRDWFVNWADFPSISVGTGGHIAAHWLQRNGTGTFAYGVRVACSTDGGRSWQPPFWLHSDRQNVEHGFASIVPQPEGRFLAVWLDGRDYAVEKTMQLRSVVFGPGGPVEPERQLDPRVCECCATAMASVAGTGPVAVFRDRSDSEIRDISVCRLQDQGWTAAVRIHADDWRVPG